MGEAAEPQAVIALERADLSTIGTILTPKLLRIQLRQLTDVIVHLLQDTILLIQRRITLPPPEQFDQAREPNQRPSRDDGLVDEQKKARSRSHAQSATQLGC